MKIIDLLNKIAKGEEVPKKFTYNEELWIYDAPYCTYRNNKDDIFEHCIIFESLNNEIEILKEVEDKEYEDIEELSYKYINTYGNISQHRKSEEPLIVTINALIRNQKYILERLDK